MDVITQAALGGAIGEASLGRKLGSWGVVWGLGFGLLPDFDVFVEPLFKPVHQFLVHRSLSHSLLFIAILTPLAGWLLYRGYRSKNISYRRWSLTVFAILSTHVLLDCLNNYGTLIFFPFSTYPVNLNTVFVIDPLYTLPLLLGVLISLFLNRQSQKRRWINGTGLFISSLYLVWGGIAKLYAIEQFRHALDRQQVDYERLMTTPTPFNTLLWTGYAEKNDTLHVGLYSLRDGEGQIEFQAIPKNSYLLRYTSHELPMQRVLWFSRGYYRAERMAGNLLVYDLRFGRSDLWMKEKGAYIWGYRFELGDDGKRILNFNRKNPNFNLDNGFWSRYWQRIWGIKHKN